MGSQTFKCFDLEEAVRSIAAATGVAERQVRTAIELLEDGNTLPFIARYRKEATSGLDETALRMIEDALAKAHELAQRKAKILRTIDQQRMLTAELRRQVEQCEDKHALEDLYLPFKPKRRTRAATACQRGLQPLADLLLEQQALGRRRSEVLRPFVNPENDVPDEQAALQGACDIVAEQVTSQNGRLGFRVEGCQVTVPVWGRHNLSAALAAVAVGRMFGMDLSAIADALAG